MDTPTNFSDNAHPIEAFYDLPGVQRVTKLIHWIDAQLMAWSAFFLILALLLIGYDNTTNYVSQSGFLTGLLGVSFAIGVESQVRTLLKYARMSWDNHNRGAALAWFISAAPVILVAFALVWSYMVKQAEGVSEAQATLTIGLTVRDIEFGRAATLMFLISMSALSYFVKPRESLAQRLAIKHEEAELTRADAEIVEAQQFKREAQLRAAAHGVVGARKVGAAAFQGRLDDDAQAAQAYTSAVDRAQTANFDALPPVAAVSFFADDHDDDRPDPTPPTTPAPTTGRRRAAAASAGGFGERGRPSFPITRYNDYETDALPNSARNSMVTSDVKDFLLSASRHYAQGERKHVPTQQEVLRYLQDCGHGFRGVNVTVKAAIASALTAFAHDGVTLAWDAAPQAMAS